MTEEEKQFQEDLAKHRDFITNRVHRILFGPADTVEQIDLDADLKEQTEFLNRTAISVDSPKYTVEVPSIEDQARMLIADLQDCGDHNMTWATNVIEQLLAEIEDLESERWG